MAVAGFKVHSLRGWRGAKGRLACSCSRCSTTGPLFRSLLAGMDQEIMIRKTIFWLHRVKPHSHYIRVRSCRKMWPISSSQYIMRYAAQAKLEPAVQELLFHVILLPRLNLAGSQPLRHGNAPAQPAPALSIPRGMFVQKRPPGNFQRHGIDCLPHSLCSPSAEQSGGTHSGDQRSGEKATERDTKHPCAASVSACRRIDPGISVRGHILKVCHRILASSPA